MGNTHGMIQTGNTTDWRKFLHYGNNKNFLLLLSVGEDNLKNITHHRPKWPWLSLTKVKRRGWGGGWLKAALRGSGRGGNQSRLKRKCKNLQLNSWKRIIWVASWLANVGWLWDHEFPASRASISCQKKPKSASINLPIQINPYLIWTNQKANKSGLAGSTMP